MCDRAAIRTSFYSYIYMCDRAAIRTSFYSYIYMCTHLNIPKPITEQYKLSLFNFNFNLNNILLISKRKLPNVGLVYEKYGTV